jgi:hypothetical protein
MSMLTCIFFLSPHIRLMSFAQVSVGYFITDLAMIYWVYPSLGGMEYVSNHMWSFLFLPFKYLLAFSLASLTHLLLMIYFFNFSCCIFYVLFITSWPLPGSSSLPVTYINSLCNVFWGRAVVYIHGPHLWSNHTRNQPPLVIWFD